MSREPTFPVGSEVTITDCLWGHGWEPGTRVRVIEADYCRNPGSDELSDGYCYTGVDVTLEGLIQPRWSFTIDEAKIA